MRRDQIIKGYRILQDFTTAGGGLSKWTFAEKGGREYFIKEFLHPTYPLPESPGSEKLKEKKRIACKAFEDHQNRLMEAINSSHIPGGNLISTLDFFRQGAKYYKVTEKVDVAGLKAAEIGRLKLNQRILIMTTVAHSLRILHRLNIVHGDLKLDNVLIKKTRMGSYTSKLIDFDNSYFSQEPPEIREDVIGDMVFYSPELAGYVARESGVKPEELTAKSDIFALGLLYTLYLKGRLPEFDTSNYRYPWMHISKGGKLEVQDEENVPGELVDMLNSMMLENPDERPDIEEVFEKLKSFLKLPQLKSSSSRGPAVAPQPERLPEEEEPDLPEEEDMEDAGSRLKGTLLGRRKKRD